MTRVGKASVPLIMLTLVATMTGPPAWGQQIVWMRQFGTVHLDGARSVSVFEKGVYVAGTIGVTVDSFYSSADAFVRKYDVAGVELWTKQFGTELVDEATGISADATGVYASGTTYGTNNDDSASFIRKYDFNGNEIWSAQIATPGPSLTRDDAHGISAGVKGVYVVGQTTGAFPGFTNAGQGDAYVIKYDTDGDLAWTRQFGGKFPDVAFGVSMDTTGVYVVGGLGVLEGVSISSDAFLRKYDFDGNELWTRQFGSTGGDFDEALCVSVDSTGVYVGGQAGDLPGHTSVGFQDAFVRKYSFDGNEIWTQEFGTSIDDRTTGVSVAGSGVYVSGAVEGALPGQLYAGSDDIFVRKYSLNGAQVWTHQFGTSQVDKASGISADGTGVYVAGTTEGSLLGQVNLGYFDAIVAKLAPGLDISIILSKYFTDALLNALPLDSEGHPKVDVVIVDGQVRSTVPGQVLTWINLTSIQPTPVSSLRVNETLPVDWTAQSASGRTEGTVHVYFVLVNGTRIEITRRTNIAISTGNPETVSVSIPDLSTTGVHRPLQYGESILVSVTMTYGLKREVPIGKYPIPYPDFAFAAIYANASFSGDSASDVASNFFVAYEKIAGPR